MLQKSKERKNTIKKSNVLFLVFNPGGNFIDIQIGGVQLSRGNLAKLNADWVHYKVSRREMFYDDASSSCRWKIEVEFAWTSVPCASVVYAASIFTPLFARNRMHC